MELTDEQLALVGAVGNVFVAACPGAGKTAAIVERFAVRAAAETRRGVALLSFTNAAIDEATNRCAGSSHLLRRPHFVGTFDSFINRFITTPLYVAANGAAPHFVDAWDTLDYTAVRTKSMSLGLTVSLDSFVFAADASAALDEARVPERYNLRKEAVANRTELEGIATQRFRSFMRSGTMACSGSRWYARRALEMAGTGDALVELITHRFAEVIVDEAQDCDPDELAILERLRHASVPLLVVADLDQAIYEFRRSDPAATRVFAAKLTAGTRLSGNFRSSPAVCSITASLRAGDDVDSAIGRHAECDMPVVLLEYAAPTALHAALTAIADEFAVPRENVVALAHARKDAAAAAGRREADIGDSAVARTARAAVTVRLETATVRERRDALTSVEKVVLGLLADDPAAGKPVARACTDLGISRRWLQTTAGRVVGVADPREHTASEYASAVREMLAVLDWPGELAMRPLGQVVRAPNADKWEAATRVELPGALRSGSIHSFKGQEAEAVAVVIPQRLPADSGGRTAVDAWEDGTDTEARRVLYVGVSRAERLLVLAAHRAHANRVESVLRRDRVPYERRPT